MSILSALSPGGPLATLAPARRGQRRGLLALYVKAVRVPKLWPGAVVVLDHLGAHRLKAVRAQGEAAGARLQYLPPYPAGPPTPSNLAWSKLRSHLRRVAARTTETLHAAIAHGLQTLSASNAQGWFKHCGYQG